MNSCLQTKLYECPKCGASYVHDRANFHACFLCSMRNQPAAVNLKLVKGAA